MDKNLQERLNKIEEILSRLENRINNVDSVLDSDQFYDFIFDDYGYNDWWSIADKIKMYEPILLALYKKLKLDLESNELDIVRKLAISESENLELRDEITKLRNELSQKDDELIELSRKINNEGSISDKEIETWQKIVDVMAHSINTDVFIAVSNLDKHRDIPRVNKALYHIKQIRDFTNLIMWYLKRNELKLSGEKESINLKEVIEKQISEIKDGISTLRIASDEHEENILKMEIVVDFQSEQPILIPKEIASAVKLIIRDLLRNAIKNTNEATPSVNVNLKSEEKVISAEIVNNIAIKKEFSKWFNNESNEEPTNISKSSKVGLRIIKMWIDLLKIDVKLIPDRSENITTTRIVFPKEIEFDSN